MRFDLTHTRSSLVSPFTWRLVLTLVQPCWYVQYPSGTELDGPNTVAGSARGTHEFRGTGSRTTMTRVPSGILGHCSKPASARWCCAAASTARPHHVVGKQHPDNRYLALRFSMPTADSAEALAFGSYPAVKVVCMPCSAQ